MNNKLACGVSKSFRQKDLQLTMSKAKRARNHSLHLDISNDQLDSLPPVAAVFLILFDVKAGYASYIQELAPLLTPGKGIP